MRSTNDNPLDPLGQLGQAIKPATVAKPDPVRQFEQPTDRPLIADHSKALEAVRDTLRGKHERDESAACDLSDAYSRLLLSSF